MKYYFLVEEVRTAVVEVEADSADEAQEKVEEAYSEDDVCLNDTKYINDGTEFYNETETYTNMVERGYPVNYIKLE